jgi:hypothetical protein
MQVPQVGINPDLRLLTISLMKSVFVLHHLHVLPHGEEDVKLIGAYSSKAAAIAAVARLKDQPGFRDFPNIVGPSDEENQGFNIDEYGIDMDHWPEGYVTV